MSENYFQTLYDVDVKEKIKQKNGLSYLSWAAAWAEVKKRYPDAEFKVYEQIVDALGNTRPWFDDGHTGWVKTGVTINGIELIENLPIMDFKNKSIAADSITSTDANKSIQRSLTKACARHGLGLYIYEGEDIPEETKRQRAEKQAKDAELVEMNQKCFDLALEKSKISKEKVAEVCLRYSSNGNPKRVDSIEKSKALYEELSAITK